MIQECCNKTTWVPNCQCRCGHMAIPSHYCGGDKLLLFCGSGFFGGNSLIVFSKNY